MDIFAIGIILATILGCLSPFIVANIILFMFRLKKNSDKLVMAKVLIEDSIIVSSPSSNTGRLLAFMEFTYKNKYYKICSTEYTSDLIHGDKVELIVKTNLDGTLRRVIRSYNKSKTVLGYQIERCVKVGSLILSAYAAFKILIPVLQAMLF